MAVSALSGERATAPAPPNRTFWSEPIQALAEYCRSKFESNSRRKAILHRPFRIIRSAPRLDLSMQHAQCVYLKPRTSTRSGRPARLMEPHKKDERDVHDPAMLGRSHRVAKHSGCECLRG